VKLDEARYPVKLDEAEYPVKLDELWFPGRLDVVNLTGLLINQRFSFCREGGCWDVIPQVCYPIRRGLASETPNGDPGTDG